MDIKSNAADIAANLQSSLDQYRKGLATQIFRATTVMQAEVINQLQNKSGLVMRSKRLLNSIQMSVDDGGETIIGKVFSSGVPYAAIQEFGGTTKAHDIYPINGKALHFIMGGSDVFAKVVHHPGSKIPPRPYFQPAFDAQKDKILQDFGLFLSLTFPLKKAG